MLPVAVIAGGLGTRLRALAPDVPKALVPVAGRPFVDWQLELLRDRGVTDVVMCVGHLGEMIEEHVADGGRFGLTVRYSHDGPKPLGTAGSLKRALPLLGARFFTIYGDSYLRCDLVGIERAFLQAGLPGLMTVFRNDGALVPSNVEYGNGRVIAYDKHTRTERMHYVDYGVSLFDAVAFDEVASNEPTDLAAVFTRLIAAGNLTGHEVADRFYEVGTPESVRELEEFLLEQRSVG